MLLKKKSYWQLFSDMGWVNARAPQKLQLWFWGALFLYNVSVIYPSTPPTP